MVRRNNLVPKHRKICFYPSLFLILIAEGLARKVSWFENYDLVNIITPVDADRLEVLLNEAGYNSQKM